MLIFHSRTANVSAECLHQQKKAAIPREDRKTNLKIWKVEKTMLVTKMCTHDDEDGEKLYNSGRFFFRSYLVDIFVCFEASRHTQDKHRQAE